MDPLDLWGESEQRKRARGDVGRVDAPDRPWDWQLDCLASDTVNKSLTAVPANWIDDMWEGFDPGPIEPHPRDWVETAYDLAHRYGFYVWLALSAVAGWAAGYYTGHLDAFAGR